MHSIIFVANAAACAPLFPPSGWMRWAEMERRGEDLHIACGQVFLQDDAAAASLLVRSPPQTGTHTLLLLMHHKTNLSSETNLVPPPHFHIYLPNSTPIDPEDLISMVTRSINSHFGQQDEAVVIISWIDEHLHRRCRNE